MSFLSAKILTVNLSRRCQKDFASRPHLLQRINTESRTAVLGLLNWSKITIKSKTKTISQLARSRRHLLGRPKISWRRRPHAGSISKNRILYAKNIAKQLIAKRIPKIRTSTKNLAYTENLVSSTKKPSKNSTAQKKMIVTSGPAKYFSKLRRPICGNQYGRRGTPDQIKTGKLRQTVPALFVESGVERPMKAVSKDTNIPIYAKIFMTRLCKKEKRASKLLQHDEVEPEQDRKSWVSRTIQIPKQISSSSPSLMYNEKEKGVFYSQHFRKP